MKLLAGGDRRLWLAVGVVAGIGLENKDTLLFLGAGLAVGLVLCRRWDVVRSPWAWAAIGIALLLWAPNLVWQAANGWPQITMAHAIAAYAADNRAQVVPLALALHRAAALPGERRGSGLDARREGGGTVARDRDRRPRRPRARRGDSGGKAYYAIGSVCVCMAAGAIVLDHWLVRGHARLKLASFAAAAALSGALIAYLTLPILPVAVVRQDVAPRHGARHRPTRSAGRSSWRRWRASSPRCPPAERAHAVILTNDYSEASPLILLGTGLPPVYSGHNAYWDWGPPPADRTVVVHVGDWRPADYGAYFIGCHDVAHIDNGLGIPNGEQGEAVTVCTGLREPWSAMWPALRTIS